MLHVVIWSWARALFAGLFSFLFQCAQNLGGWAQKLGRSIWGGVSLIWGRFGGRVSGWRQRVPPLKRPPLLLTAWGMALQLSCQAAIIVTIYALSDKSRREKGIATVGDSQGPSFDSAGFHPAPILSSSVVWTTVPAWILSAYSALWSAMLDDLREVHATLELRKWEQKRLPGADAWQRFRRTLGLKKIIVPLPRAWRWWLQTRTPPLPAAAPERCSTAKHTLLLDYGEWPVLNGLGAISSGHTLLGLCLILRAALWTAGGLSAAIFSVTEVPFEESIELYGAKFFDEYLGYDAGKGIGGSPMTPALDMVSATVVRSGANYPWTTDTHSFLPLFPASDMAGPGNYSFETEAYWATVECLASTEADLVAVGGAKLVVDGVDERNSAQLQLGYSQGGCSVNKWFTIDNGTQLYGRSWSVECSQTRGRARLGMVTGSYSPTERFHLANLTVITCAPLVYRSRVALHVSMAADAATTAQVLDFTETSRHEFWPAFGDRWLHDIPLYSVSAPYNPADMDTFSRLIVQHASGEPRLEVISGSQQLRESFRTIFQALFANYATLQAIQDAPRREPASGTLTREQTRLLVVDSAAFAVLGIVAAAFATTLVLALHLHRNRSLLAQHLELMLGDALLFRQSPARGGLDGYLDALDRKAAGSPAVQTSRGGLQGVDLVQYAKRDEQLRSWAVWIDAAGALRMEAPPIRGGGGGGSAIPLHPLPQTAGLEATVTVTVP
ncbi:hypothetical protein B0H67DRAFT_594740 [Lasiosphaeris hirsuta]|uniref:Uncharacterized protein n=1 Tax=Lasiosphaeris hirsuta TaxID=260670 RepID=A0AA39ZXY8_9PEZI|nr:hypothetical protein B0H67DRAFT_594740 [Lasiosphaeris hirsuta]